MFYGRCRNQKGYFYPRPAGLRVTGASAGKQEYLIGVEFVEGPWHASNEVKPEAADRDDVLGGNGFDVITVGIRNVE